MKVIGRYNEFPRTEVILYKASLENIQLLLENDPNIERKVQEYKLRKTKFTTKDGEVYSIPADRTLRHQIILSKEVLFVVKVKIYSVPTNSKGIKGLKLEPIESVEKKERLEESLQVLTRDTRQEFLAYT